VSSEFLLSRLPQIPVFLSALSLLIVGMAGCGSGPSATAPQGGSATEGEASELGRFRAGQTGAEVRSVWGAGVDPLLEQVTSLAASRTLSGGRQTSQTTLTAALALQRAGIRAHVVPISELAGLQTRAEGATGMGGSGTAWVAPGLRWYEAARESGSPLTRPVASDGVILKVPPGAIRILARAWISPVVGEGGLASTMRVQVVPQLFARDVAKPTAPDSGESRDLTEPAGPRVTEEVDRGQVLSRMQLEVELMPSEALVLSFDGPDDFADPAAAKQSDEKPEVGEVRRTVEDSSDNPYLPGGTAGPTLPPPQRVAGPNPGQANLGAGPVFRTPSLGEVLLTRPAPGAGLVESPMHNRRWRRLVILIPRMDGRFGLFPGS